MLVHTELSFHNHQREEKRRRKEAKVYENPAWEYNQVTEFRQI